MLKAPEHLHPNTAKWWLMVQEEYELEEHHLRLLTLAAEAWDRGQQARSALDEHGLTYLDRNNSPKTRPEVAIERDCRIGFARLVRELDLDMGSPNEHRPPALKSNRRG